ncbi:4-(cytidine 5'-diphospho)-2-C-methyl-D-erythritol kinase [Neisseria blantyrii]|uniref:4-(cytidine 5'-diphospho)-2-C-methyl-D-erythritol kinase n=1 Tax=Neisseria blantyrii TaxID=2830647 RepID=UPI00265A4C0E|nr:4-(cytidine 5'-diphospho)-2-C-methyl-D-erythritol kinase [Neisseria blantyrii]
MNITDGRQAFPAPAKLNLDLRITGRREDGYHNIESIFCLIDLQDTVYLKPRDDGKIILHNPVGGMPQEADLSYRAASLLQKYACNPDGVEIWLDKKIPTGAGLGGGSSDAATVLLVLNRWWQCGLTTPQLIELGTTLGADVPFFIFGKNAFARGIGDRLDEMDIPKQWYVIVKPPAHVSTAKIFTHEGLTRNSASSIMPTFQNLQPFRNDMQAVVFKEYPEVWKAYSELSKYGSAMMTGSGACIFAAFQDRDSAYNIYRQVSGLYEAYLAEGLSKHPLLSV